MPCKCGLIETINIIEQLNIEFSFCTLTVNSRIVIILVFNDKIYYNVIRHLMVLWGARFGCICRQSNRISSRGVTGNHYHSSCWIEQHSPHTIPQPNVKFRGDGPGEIRWTGIFLIWKSMTCLTYLEADNFQFEIHQQSIHLCHTGSHW